MLSDMEVLSGLRKNRRRCHFHGDVFSGCLQVVLRGSFGTASPPPATAEHGGPTKVGVGPSRSNSVTQNGSRQDLPFFGATPFGPELVLFFSKGRLRSPSIHSMGPGGSTPGFARRSRPVRRPRMPQNARQNIHRSPIRSLGGQTVYSQGAGARSLNRVRTRFPSPRCCDSGPGVLGELVLPKSQGTRLVDQGPFAV